MATQYDISGPFKLPVKKNDHGTKSVDKNIGLTFLDDCQMADRRGCYIFCIRGAKGSINPYYVGQASNRFDQEAFTADKVVKYNAVLFKRTHGTPVMLFVTPVSKKGKFNKHALNDLEQYLIGLAYQANEDLQNIKGIPTPSFEIVGVHSSKMGPPGSALKAFRNAFKSTH